MKFLAMACAICVGLAISGGVRAETLRHSDVENFIAALRDLRIEAGEHFDMYGDEDDDTGSAKSFSENFALMQQHSVDMEGIARKHDFADVAAWAEVGDRVMTAYVALTVGGREPEMRAQLELAKKTIESHPSMSEQQKRIALQRMNEAMYGVNELGSKASAADKDAVMGRRPG